MFVWIVAVMLTIAVSLLPFGVRADGIIAPDGRQEFRHLLDALAEKSILTPLKCQETTAHEGPKPVEYRISIEAEPNYKDAFFVHFSAVDGSRQWSTLIAYEGRDGAQLGSLNIKSYEGNTFYEHDFNGILTDMLVLKIRERLITELLYRKISSDSNRPVFEVLCPLTSF